MLLELEIDVPESRQVTLTLPPDTPVGKVRVSVQPVATSPLGSDGKFERERAAFYRLLPELMKTHRGKYVAVHNERVIAEGVEDAAVTADAYARAGYVELYVGEVTDRPRVERVITPRVVG
jgi:hypothetical protein